MSIPSAARRKVLQEHVGLGRRVQEGQMEVVPSKGLRSGTDGRGETLNAQTLEVYASDLLEASGSTDGSAAGRHVQQFVEKSGFLFPEFHREGS